MSSTIERVLFLKETELFLEVEISTLMHVANALEARSFDVGKTIIRKDEYTGGIYLIAEGEVEVSQCRKRESLGIATLSVHDAIGELSALNGTPASAYCRASTPVKCWFLPAKVLADLLHMHPRLSIGIVRMLSQRLVSTTLQVQAGGGADTSHEVVELAAYA